MAKTREENCFNGVLLLISFHISLVRAFRLALLSHGKQKERGRVFPALTSLRQRRDDPSQINELAPEHGFTPFWPVGQPS